MEYKAHDTIAKVVMRILAPHRELTPEAELRIPVYGDILLRPGPPLPDASGLMGHLVGESLCLLEFFSLRPAATELIGAQTKGWMGIWLEARSTRPFAGVQDSRIIIVSNGRAHKALARVWPEADWKPQGPGHWVLETHPRLYYLDLLRLPVTPETCWLHVAGDSVWSSLAMERLVASQDQAIQALIVRLQEEVPHMQVENTQDQEPATRRFLSAWEEAAALRRGRMEGRNEGRMEGRNEGRTEGRNEGRLEGLQLALRLMLVQRFGETAGPLMAQLESIQDPAVLESLAGRILTVSSPENLLTGVDAPRR